MPRPHRLLALLTSAFLVLVAPAVPAGAVAAQPAAAPSASSTLPSSALATAPSSSTLQRQLRRALARGDGGGRVWRLATPRLEDLNDDGWEPAFDCGATAQETTHEICMFGDPDGARDVVVLGSSHATMWMPGFEPAARAGGTRLFGLFKYGCSPIVQDQWLADRPWPECTEWRRWALDRVAELRPDAVVVATHHYTLIEGADGRLIRRDTRRYDRAYATGLRKLGRRLAGLTDQVTIMGDNLARPAAVRPLRCLEQHDMRMGPCEASLDRRTRRMNARDARAAAAVGARFVDPNRFVCIDRRCPVAAARHFVYRDFSHVSSTWAEHVGPVLSRAVRLTG